MSKITTLPLAALLMLSAAGAQSMDYGAVEDLFGEPATTSATGSPQRATDVPANMIIVTRQEIARSGARDIPSILRQVAGVDVLQWGSDNYDVSARGYNQAYSARTLVLVDGRQVYVDSFGFTPWSALPVELGTIRQIEVVKGPNAALFGFNAVAGVINIITDNPRYDNLTSAAVRAGSQSLLEASGTARLAWGRDAFFRLSAGSRSDKPFGTANPLSVDGTPRRKNGRSAVDAKAVIVLPADIELQFEANHSQATDTEVSGGYKLQTSQYVTNAVMGRLLADTGWGLVKLSGYSNWVSWSRTVGPGSAAPKLQNQLTVMTAEDVFSPAPDHTLRLAVAYRHNDVAPTDRRFGWISFDAGSASAMWNWQILPDLALTNALRYDGVSYTSRLSRAGPAVPPSDGPPFRVDEWSFNSGLVWKTGPHDTLRLIASRGVQLPNLVQVWDSAAAQPPPGPMAPPLPLRPTKVINFEALWNHGFTALDARLQIAAFHQETRDVISIGSGTFDAPGSPGMAPINVGSSAANGLEISLDGTLATGFTWSLGYRLEVIDDDYVKGIVRTDLVNYEDTTPQHVLKAGLGYTTGRWQIDGHLLFQSNVMGLRRIASRRLMVPIAPYATIEARLAYRLTDRFTVALSGQNLVNAQQQQTSGPDVERQLFVTLSLDM